MIVTHRITMDLAQPGVAQRIYAVQDDIYSRNLEMRLFSGGVAWDPPEDTNVVVFYRKSDGTGGEYDTLPDGTGASAIEGNILTVALAPQVLTVPGMVFLGVTLMQGTREISTFAVHIVVQKKIGVDFQESQDYVNLTRFLRSPESAQVGQYLRVLEVDENGQVKKLEAVDVGGGSGGVTEETDPTVPAWAKEPEKPSYTASEVGADPTGTAAGAVATHNVAQDAHNDIRLLVQGLTTRLNALANSDDTTLDQMAEVVAYIKDNRDLIEQITTGKVNTSDIIDNLTTSAANKPLSAKQGVALKALIDAITIPTQLPSPGKLTFTGGATGEYDGSADKQIAIPTKTELDTSLTVSGKAADAKAVGDELDKIKADPAYFVTNYTNNGDGTVTADHTYAEQVEAFNAGKTLIAKMGTLYYGMPQQSVMPPQFVYSLTRVESNKVIYRQIAHRATSDTVSITETSYDYATKDDLANIDPQALFITNYYLLDDGETWYADHTYEEQLAAFGSGKILMATVEGALLQMLTVTDGTSYGATICAEGMIASYLVSHGTDDSVLVEPTQAGLLTDEILQQIAESIPTKTSQLTNDSGYQTAEQVTTAINNALGVIENGSY